MKTFEFNPTENSCAVAYLHTPLTEMDNYRKEFPVVVVLPGGGYEYCSVREGDPIAFEYFTAGYNVILLKQYSCKEKASHYRPLLDVYSTIQTIRKNAKEWNCSDQIAVCGFSAGGHLAASAGIMWNKPEVLSRLNSWDADHKPNAMILSYPVILANEFAHEGSIRYVSGAVPGTEEYKYWSMDTHVTPDCCPAFLWHTVTDASVPVENTLAMLNALQRNHISYECHLFPEGKHGLSICSEETGSYEPYNSRWMDMSIQWLNKQFNFKK